MVRRLSAVSCGLVSCQPDAWTVYCGGRLAVVATDGDQLLLDLEIDDTAAGYDRLIGQLVRLVTRPEGVTVVTTVSCSIVAELLNAAGVTLVAVDEKEAWRLAELSGLAGYAAEPVGHAGRPGRRPAGSAGQVARPDRYAARPGSPGQRAAGLAGALVAGVLRHQTDLEGRQLSELAPLLNAHWATLACERSAAAALGGTSQIAASAGQYGWTAMQALSEAVRSAEESVRGMAAAGTSLMTAVTAELGDPPAREQVPRSARWPEPAWSPCDQETQILPRIRAGSPRPGREIPSPISDQNRSELRVQPGSSAQPGLRVLADPRQAVDDALDRQAARFWIVERGRDWDTPLVVDQRYTGVFHLDRQLDRFADPVDCEWLVWSTSVELSRVPGPPQHDRCEFHVVRSAGTTQWLARFPMRIAGTGPSPSQPLLVTPRCTGVGGIEAMIRIRGDVHRELSVCLRVVAAPPAVDSWAGPSATDSWAAPTPVLATPTLVTSAIARPTVARPVVAAPGIATSAVAAPAVAAPVASTPSRVPSHLAGYFSDDLPQESSVGEPAQRKRSYIRRRQRRHPLRARQPAVTVQQRYVIPSQECGAKPVVSWQQHRRRLNVVIMPPSIQCSSDELGVRLTERFSVRALDTEFHIRAVRSALDQILNVHGNQFDSIDTADLANRLEEADPSADWTHDGDRARHRPERQDVIGSEEFRQLAEAGYQLYCDLFPERSALRTCLDALEPGDLLNVTWHKESGDPWISHLPWGLMYRKEPVYGHPIAPSDFLGLRLRISFHAHSLQWMRPSVTESPTRAHLLYWGGRAGDVTWKEAKRHAHFLSAWQPLTLPKGPDGKREVRCFLQDPKPPPVDLVYFYCRSLPRTSSRPGLIFGSHAAPENTLYVGEMGFGRMTDQPLVFANACETNVADERTPNDLEQHFFNRGARAYIGTECLVPPAFAARFAETFFHFLHAENLGPITAGEAFTQARRFLWNEYGNCGGLFYSYVNDYRASVGPTRSGQPSCQPLDRRDSIRHADPHASWRQ